ncbi:MAG: CBS domain-containing protein, partial [Bryobacteraceae bacterium]
VRDAMHSGDEVAWVRPETSLRDVVIAMTERPLGAACVLDGNGRLAGLITDGDLRRALERHDDIRTLTAAEVMTRHPVTVSPEALLAEALVLMERRPRQLSVLPVVDAGGLALGLLRLHDIYQAR